MSQLSQPPDSKRKRGKCLNICPHMQPFTHPFYRHSAWCNYALRQLSWYDGAYIAQCEQVSPDEKLFKLVETGWKGNPEYKVSKEM